MSYTDETAYSLSYSDETASSVTYSTEYVDVLIDELGNYVVSESGDTIAI